MDRILNALHDFAQAIRDINARYKTPRIKTTRMVSFWLLMLRIYLIAMLVLLVYKFITVAAIH